MSEAASGPSLGLRDFWYIAALSDELRADAPLARRILGEHLVLFRDSEGHARAFQDRCVHRAAPLSKGKVVGGMLQCPYHAWTYAGDGRVARVPSEGPACKASPSSRRAATYDTREIDDYIYVRLGDRKAADIAPFRVPEYRRRGWQAIRLVNRFANNVTNCAENFVDIPHTVSVHPGIFRKEKGERFGARVSRKDGSVHVHYRNERANLGYFSWFLNPGGAEITHVDSFHMPNVTSVRYAAGRHRVFLITSQSVPVTDEETLVYTDLTYDYGGWGWLARPIVRQQAQKIIDQDIEILRLQMERIRDYGDRFMNGESDLIHLMIESIRGALARGQDPRQLPEKVHDIEFWV